MSDGPIYIGGLDRCGKTTMQAFLASHPRIAIPYVGSNLWRYFYRQYGDLADDANFERALAALMSYSHVQFLKPDPARVRREFRQGEATYARLFALLHAHYAEQQGKPRWGDQTGLLECYADQLFAADPSAKMIHMLRDPRDRYAASLARAPKGKGRVGGAVARWLYSVRLAERNTQRYPDRYLVVRYEQLVAQPEQSVAAVCAFLEEEFFPDMLLMHGSPQQRDKLARGVAGEQTGPPVTTGFIGGYRGVIPDRELAFMQIVAGRAMVAYGYQLDAIHFSVADWFAFALTECPANLLRALAWRTLEAAQEHQPLRFGRKPDKKSVVSHTNQQGKSLADKLMAG